MKIDNRIQRGFSLTELLIVISIIIVLAGITIGALPGIQGRMDRAKIETFLEELKSGLSSYEVEYGGYPVSPPNGDVQSAEFSYRDQAGQEGASILYRALSGDRDGDGEVDDDEIVFVKGLLGKANATSKNKRVAGDPSGGGFLVVDSFNDPIRYLAERRNKLEKMTFNPTFDVWSIAGTDPGSAADPETQAAYVSNWTRNN